MAIMALCLFITFCILLVPSWAFAWGPLTHMYLGSEVIALAPAIPAAVYALIRRYKCDFLYGNIMADSVLGKKHLPFERHQLHPFFFIYNFRLRVSME